MIAFVTMAALVIIGGFMERDSVTGAGDDAAEWICPGNEIVIVEFA